jgi:hypothetical protein
LDTTGSDWLAAQFAGDKRFGGVFANDALRPQPNKGYILNLQDSDEPGSHWVALYNGYYMDSYGCPPTQEIAPYVKDWNRNDYQGFSSEACGYFAIYALKQLFAGRSPYENMIPDKYQHNENVLKAYFF